MGDGNNGCALLIGLLIAAAIIVSIISSVIADINLIDMMLSF